MKNICIFVSSSDNTKDILLQVSKSYSVFWQNCPFTKYVGLNTKDEKLNLKDFQPIYAQKSSWRTELLDQITLLPNRFEYILLILDDFLILSPVNEKRLNLILFTALQDNINYLRLIPLSRAFFPKVFHWMGQKNKSSLWEPINGDMPYYSSLQIALWRREHLINMLNLGGSIWEFENQKIEGINHYSVVKKSPIKYIHVVEKGRWQPYARCLFKKVNLPFKPGHRPENGLLLRIQVWFNLIKFNLIGYSWVRLKRKWIKKSQGI